MIKILKAQPKLLLFCFVAFVIASAANCQEKYDYHPFVFGCSNLSDKEIFIKSVKVLNNNVRSGGRYPNTQRSGSISFDRKDCTPEALLKTSTKIIWWDRKFFDPDPSRGYLSPTDPSKLRTSDLPFPEMDVGAYRWDCQYTLQPDLKWVGQFYGAKAKTIGAEEPSHNISKVKPDQSWINMQFKNLTDKQVYFTKFESKLVATDQETHLFLPLVPADGKFHGFAAHSQRGSMYRPLPESKIIFDWGHTGSDPEHASFELPNFSNKKKNWYCYFILNKSGKWSASYEGVEQD